jgi:hypothetical protein
MMATAALSEHYTFPGSSGAKILPFVNPYDGATFPGVQQPYPLPSDVAPLCSAHNCFTHATLRFSPTERPGQCLPFCDEHIALYLHTLGSGFVRLIKGASRQLHPALGQD